jgi:CheY-like chemotaxis protein
VARVTVINDSSEFLELMQEMLTGLGHQMAGFRAVKVPIDDVLESAPDVMIVDLVLENTAQEVSGWELMLLARSHRATWRVPIILCSGDVWELKRRATDLASIADVHVVTKPFSLDEMAELLERLLARATSDAAEDGMPDATFEPALESAHGISAS